MGSGCRSSREQQPESQDQISERIKGKLDNPETFPSIYGTSMKEVRNLVMTVQVEGRSVLAVVDTAAQVSVLNINLAREWVKNKKSTSSHLRGIGDALVPARIVHDVRFTIGDNEYSNTFYLAEIGEDMLLGIDFLAENRAVIDFSRQEIRLGNQVMVASLVRENSEYVAGCRVELMGRTRIPAHCTTYAEARLTKKMTQEFIFTPSRDAVPCLVPTTFHPKGDRVIIQMVNDTENTVHLESGMVVGTATGARELSIEKGGRKVRKVERGVGGESKVPVHLEDLYDRSAKDLTPEEAQEFLYGKKNRGRRSKI